MLKSLRHMGMQMGLSSDSKFSVCVYGFLKELKCNKLKFTKLGLAYQSSG